MRNIIKIVVDFALLGIPALIALILNLFVKPYQRGLFCDDETIMYPYKDDTITIIQVAIAGIIVSILLIFIVETALRFLDSSHGKDARSLKVGDWTVSPYIQNLYHFIGMQLFAMSINQIITDGTKFAVGRLRPHFMDICKPVLPDGSTCRDPDNWNRHIADFTCSNRDATPRQLKDARISFPSGHASFAFVAAFFCIFYIQSRIHYKGSKLLKHFIQLVFFSGALFTALSRISDHKHHYTDVLAGAIIGTTVAYAVALHVSNLFKNRRYFNHEADV